MTNNNTYIVILHDNSNLITYDGMDFDWLDLQKDAEEGDTCAMYYYISIVNFCSDDAFYKSNKEKSYEYIKKLASLEMDCGYYWLAELYERGITVEKDSYKAIELYEKAENAGAGFSYERIGKIYFYGNGIRKDYKKAYEYFKNSRLKSESTYFYLGEMYRLGLYVGKDMNTARKYYQEAVDHFSEYPDIYKDFSQKRLDGYDGVLEEKYDERLYKRLWPAYYL